MSIPKRWIVSSPWVILDKTNGRYIVGGTALEPMELEKNRSPRLFTTERQARNFLTQWSRGKMHQDRDGYVICKHVPSRIKDDMAIVQLHLIHYPT